MAGSSRGSWRSVTGIIACGSADRCCTVCGSTTALTACFVVLDFTTCAGSDLCCLAAAASLATLVTLRTVSAAFTGVELARRYSGLVAAAGLAAAVGLTVLVVLRAVSLVFNGIELARRCSGLVAFAIWIAPRFAVWETRSEAADSGVCVLTVWALGFADRGKSVCKGRKAFALPAGFTGSDIGTLVAGLL